MVIPIVSMKPSDRGFFIRSNSDRIRWCWHPDCLVRAGLSRIFVSERFLMKPAPTNNGDDLNIKIQLYRKNVEMLHETSLHFRYNFSKLWKILLSQFLVD